MISEDIRQSIFTLHTKGMKIRAISRALGVSRNTVRQVIQGSLVQESSKVGSFDKDLALIAETYQISRGNVVRVQEILKDHGVEIPYSTLTRIVREMGLRQPPKVRAGAYSFAPGEEMQHDTSPHKLSLNGKTVSAQCAGLVLAYSRRLFIRYYPCFTRFEARVFLCEAFRFMHGVCPQVVIDNTSVIVARGSGPTAEINAEMEAFGRIFGITFVPHRIGHPDRKARIERPFAYVEKNFLAGRTFRDWSELNEQAERWCIEVANPKPKRSLGMSPDHAFVMEKPYLSPLPPYIPPIYQTLYRVVDVEGYVNVDTNRYSVPDRLIGKKVEAQKHGDRVVVVFDHKKVAEHARIMDKRDARATRPGHHRPRLREKAHLGPSPEEMALMGESEILDRYVSELRKRSSGRGIQRLRRLLNLKRDYPAEAFLAALSRALDFGLYDLARLEKLIIDHVAGDFFRLTQEEGP
jgi:transposase